MSVIEEGLQTCKMLNDVYWWKGSKSTFRLERLHKPAHHL